MSAVSERGLSDPHRVSEPLRSEALPDDELLPRPKGTALWWPLVCPNILTWWTTMNWQRCAQQHYCFVVA